MEIITSTVPVMTIEQKLEYRELQLEFVQLRLQVQELQTKIQAVAKRMNDTILTVAGETAEGLSFDTQTLTFTSTKSTLQQEKYFGGGSIED